MKTLSVSLLVLALLVSCRPTADPSGRVAGRVLAQPTCPVQRPGEVCPPTAVAGTVRFVVDDREVGWVRIGEDGSYSLNVPPGGYTVLVDAGDTPYPRCAPVEVVIALDRIHSLDILCDTGIR